MTQCYHLVHLQACGDSPRPAEVSADTGPLCPSLLTLRLPTPDGTVWSGCTTVCEGGRWGGAEGHERQPKGGWIRHLFTVLTTTRMRCPSKTRLQFIHQAFPVSAKKHKQASGWFVFIAAPSVALSHRFYLVWSKLIWVIPLWSEHIISALNSLLAQFHLTILPCEPLLFTVSCETKKRSCHFLCTGVGLHFSKVINKKWNL